MCTRGEQIPNVNVNGAYVDFASQSHVCPSVDGFHSYEHMNSI